MMSSTTTDTTLHIPKGRFSATLTGYFLRVLMSVAPKALMRMAEKQDGQAPLMSFPDLLRIVQAMNGHLPDPTPESRPGELLKLHPELTDIHVSDLSILGPHDSVPARLYTPITAPVAGFVWIHGGAFIAGSLDSSEANWVSLELAKRGITVLSLDYRKALRGVRYPAPLDDVTAGWEWAVDHADQLGVPADEIHLGGGSAGANLAGGLAKKLRDLPGATTPKSLVLVVPFMHPSNPPIEQQELARRRVGARGSMFEPADLGYVADNYAGVRSALSDPYAFPANGDVSGLPPTLVLTSEFDSIRASGEAFAAALKASSVDVTLHMVPNAPHAALAQLGTPEGQEALGVVSDWLASPNE